MPAVAGPWPGVLKQVQRARKLSRWPAGPVRSQESQFKPFFGDSEVQSWRAIYRSLRLRKSFTLVPLSSQ